MKIDLLPHWTNKRLINVPELCAKIISGMEKDGTVLLHTHEPQNPAHNGLYDVLDQLCRYYNWDKSKFCIATANPTFTHPEYKTMSTKMITFSGLDSIYPTYPWNREKSYGMFIARATSSRIAALVKHRSFKYKDQGLTSFNSVIRDSLNDISDYVLEFDQLASSVENIQPYSDIDPISYKPIWQVGSLMTSANWSNVYRQIGVEIVCETSVEPDCYGITEKTLRPIFYNRPFIIIGSKGYVNFLKENGIKTFDPIIPDDYDQHDGPYRINRVFEILQGLISNNKLEILHEECQDIFNHNRRQIYKLKKEIGTSVPEYYRYIESIPGY